MSVYLHLFHGRDDPAQDMDDWGEDGPIIGPLNWVHCTYMCDIKTQAPYDVAKKFFPAEAQAHLIMQQRNNRGPDEYPVDIFMRVREDLVEHNGKYYGDWSVSTHRGPEHG